MFYTLSLSLVGSLDVHRPVEPYFGNLFFHIATNLLYVILCCSSSLRIQSRSVTQCFGVSLFSIPTDMSLGIMVSSRSSVCHQTFYILSFVPVPSYTSTGLLPTIFWDLVVLIHIHRTCSFHTIFWDVVIFTLPQNTLPQTTSYRKWSQFRLLSAQIFCHQVVGGRLTNGY